MKKRPQIEKIDIREFDYELPQDRIALEPTEHRDASRLLISNGKGFKHDHYTHVADHLPANALLVFNNTKVIAARLHFTKTTGAIIEVFLLEPADGNYKALTDVRQSSWKCLVGGAKKWKYDETLQLSFHTTHGEIILSSAIAKKSDDHCIINFTWNKEIPFSEVIDAAGKIPLPPYIKRAAVSGDKNRYQTVYAKHEGSVAAPTAGLHFTEEIFNRLHEKNIQTIFITLHVGAGTFKPVSAPSIAEHIMHEEYIEVKRELIEALYDATSMVVAVGTTSLRTIESLYWIGVKIIRGEKLIKDKLHLSQWEHLALSNEDLPSRRESMQAILTFMDEEKTDLLQGHTGICITPGYEFKTVEALVTNFHQPQSTLLLIIAAILRDAWKTMYAVALENGYRFLSYGDGSLLFINKEKH